MAEVGELGEEIEVRLEVKLLADVALVGAPNSGKSTLLSVVSRAKPKIADYPFTTLEPVLGVVDYRGRQFVALDVPGLIEGAHEGRGLGFEFLRHVERVRVIVHLVDGSELEVGEEYRRIAREIEAYPGGLASKPRVVVLNKVDLPEVGAARAEKLAELEAACGSRPLSISGATGEGVGVLLDRLVELLPTSGGWDGADESEEERGGPTEKKKARPVRERISVDREDGVFVVGCRRAERFAPLVNFDNWRARLQFHAELERLGVIDALEKAGVAAGDTVRIASRELEWD